MTFFSDGKYYLLYEEVDESEVDLLSFPMGSGGETEEFRFPRPGTKNARSTLKLASFTTDASGDTITDAKTWEMSKELEAFFPWVEYIARAGWTPDGKL